MSDSSAASGGQAVQGAATANTAAPVTAGSGGAGRRASNTPKVRLHAPEHVDGYWVTEDQLAILESGKRDGLLEVFWGALALGAGSLPSVAVALSKAYGAEPRVSLTAVDQVQFAMTIAGFVVALFCAGVILTRKKRTSDVGKQIRAQKK